LGKLEIVDPNIRRNWKAMVLCKYHPTNPRLSSPKRLSTWWTLVYLCVKWKVWCCESNNTTTSTAKRPEMHWIFMRQGPVGPVAYHVYRDEYAHLKNTWIYEYTTMWLTPCVLEMWIVEAVVLLCGERKSQHKNFRSTPQSPVFTRYKRLSKRLYNPFDNRLNEQPVVKPGCSAGLTTGLTTGCIHDATCGQTGCQTGLTTGWMFLYAIQPVVKPVW